MVIRDFDTTITPRMRSRFIDKNLIEE